MSTGLFFKRTFTYVLQNGLKANFSMAVPKVEKKGPLLISCKRKELDHHLGVYYDKFEQVPLASKGWNHSKAKNDYFMVLPIHKDIEANNHLFSDFNIDPKVIEALRRFHINSATDFQSKAIPTILTGAHTILAAETGCGKTVSYLLPIIQLLMRNKPPTQLNTPRAVIVVPNRELAYQIGDIAAALCNSVGLTVETLVGGNTKRKMLNPTFDDIDVLVATPGALGKLSTVGIYKLGEVQTLVLDEADTLIDDSFIERIENLIKKMSQAQMVLVSATLPRKLPDILAPYSESMEQVISPNLHKPLLNIYQKFMRITNSLKPANLLQIAKVNKDPMLVFTNRNQTCKWLAIFLRENGIPCSNISGDMNYAIRIEQWNQFVRRAEELQLLELCDSEYITYEVARIDLPGHVLSEITETVNIKLIKGETKILSATDIGSRGLNTIQVKHVINYDFPLYAADYIHRIGRVGRIGSPESCKVTNFICSAEEIQLVQQIELCIRKDQPLTNVDGNITNIVRNKILKKIRESS